MFAKEIIMGMQENWHKFVDLTKAKSNSHMKAARYWDTVNNVLSLMMIFLGAITTALALINGVPALVVAGIAGVTTLFSTVSAFLRPNDRKTLQADASKEFRTLMLKMVRCETEREYEELWKELNSAIVDEPFLPKKYVTPMKMDWSITPELTLVIDEKEKEVAAALGASQDLKIDIPCVEVQSNSIERGSDNALFNEREDIKVDKEEIELANRN